MQKTKKLNDKHLLIGSVFFLLLIVLTFFPIARVNGNSITTTQASQPQSMPLSTYPTLMWPIKEDDPLSRQSSPFGPRLEASEGYRYDFHRGIDLKGTTSEEAIAAASGTIFRVYDEGSSAYPDGGNVVIVRHTLKTPITFKGQTIKNYYTLYMHLDRFSDKVIAWKNGGTNTLSAGETVGYIGRSGGASYDHLHFEVRLGTTCSLEYQLKNPEACSIKGFDPHINPLTFMQYDETSTSIHAIQDQSTVTVTITSPRQSLGVNRIAIVSTEHEQVIDFNTRDGFDATSTQALDNPTQKNTVINPLEFNSKTEQYAITITFKNLSEQFSMVKVTDVHGKETEAVIERTV